MELVSWQRGGNSLQNIHFNVEKICGKIMTPLHLTFKTKNIILLEKR